MNSLRTAPLIALPLVTLFVGWQLGVGYEQGIMRTTIVAPVSQSGALLSNPQKQANLSVFWQVWSLLNTHYNHPEQMNAQTMIYGATKGLVAALGDPYTVFLTPKENQQFKDTLSGQLQGIGAELTLTGGEVTVVSLIKSSPAEKAGLLPKDIITKANGTSLADKTIDDVVTLIRGPKGTPVTLTVIRGQETTPRTFTIVRDNIEVPSVEYEVKKSGTTNIGLLTINEFGNDTITEVQTMLQDVPKQHLKGLIIDLRDNGGGYLDGAVSLVSMFLKDGKVVTVDSHNEGQEVHMVNGNPAFPDLPLVILVNHGTASASEITAGALQDHKRATIVGEQTFGKGTVQEVLDLPDGSSLKVTIARWLTPNGKDLGKEGVTPDIVIDRTAGDYAANHDPQLDAAMNVLLKK